MEWLAASYKHQLRIWPRCHCHQLGIKAQTVAPALSQLRPREPVQRRGKCGVYSSRLSGATDSD